MISSTKTLLYKCMDSILEHEQYMLSRGICRSVRCSYALSAFKAKRASAQREERKKYKIAKKTRVVKTNRPLVYILTIYIGRGDKDTYFINA